MENVLNFKWKKGVKEVFPAHPMVQNWLFTEDTEAEAMLAHQMAVVAEKSGMTVNDLQHIFPAVLRMLKNDSALNEDQGHGICKENGCNKFAVIDYNGHGHWNCQSCYDRNERYFEDEYR